MSRKLCSVFIALCLALFAAGNAYAAKKIILKVNAPNNPKAFADHPQVIQTLEFKRLLEEKFPDRVQVRIFWDDQLAKTYDGALNNLQNNVMHLQLFPMTSMAEYTKAAIPFTNLFLVPYPHVQIIYDAFDGEIGEMVRERMIREARVRPIFYWEVGFRHLLNNKTPIEDVSSLAGMKFRVQPNPVHLESFRALGANPTPIQWAELFTALQQGVVDGTENPFENIRVGRLYEVQKYLTLSGHAFEMAAICMGEEFYQSLPEDIREYIGVLNRELTAKHREGMAVMNQEMLQLFKDKGMQVNELSPEGLVKFREAVKPAIQVSRDQAGAEYTDKFLELMTKYEADYFARVKQ